MSTEQTLVYQGSDQKVDFNTPFYREWYMECVTKYKYKHDFTTWCDDLETEPPAPFVDPWLEMDN